MYLSLMVKWIGSGGSGCPSVYATEDPEVLVIQGGTLDPHTRANLQHVLNGEDAVTLPKETLLRAAKMLESQQ